MLNAQSALASARLQRIQALLDWHVSRASLAKAVGVLDSSLLNPAEGGNKAAKSHETDQTAQEISSP